MPDAEKDASPWPCVTHGVAGCEKCWPRVAPPAEKDATCAAQHLSGRLSCNLPAGHEGAHMELTDRHSVAWGWTYPDVPHGPIPERVTSPAKSLRQIASEHGITPVGTDIDIETGKRVLPPASGRAPEARNA